MASRPIIVGQAPSRQHDFQPPFSGRSGKRLANLAGIEDIHDAFDTINIFPSYPGDVADRSNGKGDPFPLQEARRRAESLRETLKGRVVILAGKNVARAFGKRFDLGPLVAERDEDGTTWVLIPHPSGINLQWNNPIFVENVRRFLRALVRREAT